MKRSVIVMCVFAIISVFSVRPLCAVVSQPLTIKRIELYFDNNRPEITVNKDFEKLKAYAKITFAYSGLLEGHWEVDGRIVSRVSEHLTAGNVVLLQTSDALRLPTFDAGTHVVKFVITRPSEKMLPVPSLLYFVTAQGAQRSQAALKTTMPSEGASLRYEPAVVFTWEKLTDNATYIIQFYKDPVSTPIFSSCTTDISYKLPSALFRKVFKPGMKYYWRVKGSSGKEEAESPLREFSFKTSGKGSNPGKGFH
jgi:hypothetical protein